MMRAAQAEPAGPAGIVPALIAEAQRIADEDVDINRRMGAHGAALIQDGFNILTHCNAGSLATVDYGTALAVVRVAHEQGKRLHVWSTRRAPPPGSQADRLGADAGRHPHDPHRRQRRRPPAAHRSRDIVLVGSDRTAANGDVANKIGTYKLAVLARRTACPFTRWCPLDRRPVAAERDDIPIEERDAREVTHVDGCQIAPTACRC